MQVSVRDAAALLDMVQAIEMIAARRISEAFQAEHPAIDWRNTIGLRNVIAHRYDQVQQEVIWRIVQTVLLDVVVLLRGLLPPVEDDLE